MKKTTYKTIASIFTASLMLGASTLLFNSNALAKSITTDKAIVNNARIKIVELQKLMKQAQAKHLDVEREKATVWFANQFLHFADYDQKHIKDHIQIFKSYAPLEKDATKLGKNLPHFERTDVLKMLNTSITTIKNVISGKIIRKPVNKVDWAHIKIKNGQFYNKNNNRPIFLYDYFSKALWDSHSNKNLYNDYLGNLAQAPYICLNMLKNEQGDLENTKFDPTHKKTKPTIDGLVNYDKIYPNMKGHIGTIPLWHGRNLDYSVVPKWALNKYGKDKLFNFTTGFSSYDINSPYIRQMWTTLFSKIIPKLKGTSFTKLGYRLANEPHWYVDTKNWGFVKSGLGPYGMAKFQEWLKKKHHNNIKELNTLWHSSYKSFSQIKFKVPFDVAPHNGTPLLYDWSRFSMDNISNWFQFLNDGIKRNDPDAHTSIKISSVFADVGDVRTNGIDPEALTNITDFIGNDVKIRKDDAYDNRLNVYKKKYAFYWRDVAMSYALYNSFSPNKINVNSESHFMSQTRARDLYMEPEYVRSSYWLATISGMNANLTWYWARMGDGSFESKITTQKAGLKNFPGSNAEMPRATNEYLQTMYDLNANSEDITKFQRQAMPIRVFYSETSSINRQEHIDETFHMFEKLYFNGLPIGFATQKILNNKSNDINNTKFDDLVIYKTTNATQEEFKSVQDYLNRGGTVIIDKESFKLDEYNRPLNKTLTQGKGKLIHINNNTLYNMSKPALKYLKPTHIPSINLTEHNSLNKKGVMWRVTQGKDGSNILTAVNLGKTTAKINLSSPDHKVLKIKNLLTGQTLSDTIKLQSEGTLLLKIN